MKNLKSMLLTLILLPLMAVAQTSLYVVTGSGTSFTAAKSGIAVGTGAIQDAIDAIKTDANGEPCEIQFENGTDTLDIGSSYITFNDPNWGVTLSGKITSANLSFRGTIYLNNGASIKSEADIINTYSGGVAIHNHSTGTLNIIGGTISANYSAVSSDSGSVTLGGSPTITGGIRINVGKLSVITGGENAFVPDEKVYKLDFRYRGYTIGDVAVINGKDFIENFAVADTSYALLASDNNSNLLIAYYNGYNFAKDGTAYTVAKARSLFSTIQAAINAIKTDANGEPCEIQFGNGTDTLDTGFEDITFYDWDVTLSGKITSTGSYTIYNAASIKSKADIINASGYGHAIYNSSTGTVNISGGTISATGDNSYAVYNSSTGTVNISGGTISATDDYAVYNNSTGTVNIAGGTISATDNYAVYNSSTGTVNISGGTISANSYAVYNSSTGTINITGGTISANSYAVGIYSGSVTLGGSPTIRGYIRIFFGKLSVLTEGENAFAPGKKVYTLDSGYRDYTIGDVAVINGKDFIENFAFARTSYALLASDNNSNLLIAYYNGYNFAKEGTTYTVAKAASLLFSTIQAAIDAIKTDANGEPCEIQFGNGADTLDIGDEYITFNGSNWDVTLSGKITSANYDYNTIYLDNGASIKSEADIISTYRYAVRNNSTGTVNISGGTISANGITVINSSTGTVNITGGTISSSVYNTSTGIVNITGGTISSCVSNSSGIVNISGGTISSSGNSVVRNSSGTLNITGGTISANGNSSYAVLNSSGIVNISGGTISATGDYSYAVHNSSTETVNITGGTISANGNNSSYAVYNSSTGTVNISGGTISATGNYAVYSYSGSVTLGGSPTITGGIRINFGILSVLTEGENAFDPGEKVYTLDFFSYTIGGVAVINGKNFIENFAFAYTSLGLLASNNNSNLLIAYYNNYNFAKDGTTYTVTKALSLFSTIQAAIDAIKTDANGEPCEIQFGNGTDTLDIGSSYITFNDPDWDVTLSGKITSATNFSYGTIHLSDGASIKSEADIINTHSSGEAIYNTSTGTVNITGGTISANGYYTIYNASTGTVNISGGTISANGNNIYGSAVLNSSGIVNISGGTISVNGNDRDAVFNNSGIVNISGGTISVNGNSSSVVYNNSIGTVNISGGTISSSGSGVVVYNNSTGTVNISGGTISATSDNKYAVLNYCGGSFNPPCGSVTLGGSPTITGIIYAYYAINLSVLTEGENAFAPGEKVYTLGFSDLSYGAVINGKDFIENFAVANTSYGLGISGNNLVFKTKINGYIFTKNETSYTITEGLSALATTTIQDAIDAIKTDANGEPCEIQFGNGTDTLDIGSSYITFNEPDWDVTLSGKITSTNSYGTIYLNNGASARSKADIINTYSSGKAIYNSSTGTVNISGGTISANSDNEYAVFNYSSGSVTLGGSPAITGIINVRNLSIITEGENAFAPGEKVYTLDVYYYTTGNVAVTNGANFLKNFTSANPDYGLEISGNDLVLREKINGYIFTKNETSYTITEGLSALATTIQNAIDAIKTDANGEPCEIQFGNGTDTLDIGDADITFNEPDWDVTLSGKITSTNYYGTIYLNNGASIRSKADIINTYSSGKAIFNTSTGTVNITGGTISAHGDNSYAVYNYSGSVTLGGSPAITGIIKVRNLSVLTEGENAFAPGEKVYTLGFSDYIIGGVAVTNGKDFSKNFVTTNDKVMLKAEGNDLVFAEADEAACTAEGKIWESNKCWTESELAEAACIADGKTWENNTCQTEAEICIAAGKVWENKQCTTPIHTPQIAASQIRAQSIPNGIMLQNLPQNAKIEAYNLQGKQIYMGNSVNSQILRIMVQTKGIYVIKVSQGSQKQILRVPVR